MNKVSRWTHFKEILLRSFYLHSSYIPSLNISLIVGQTKSLDHGDKPEVNHNINYRLEPAIIRGEMGGVSDLYEQLKDKGRKTGVEEEQKEGENREAILPCPSSLPPP